jgi:hypothetical protein
MPLTPFALFLLLLLLPLSCHLHVGPTCKLSSTSSSTPIGLVMLPSCGVRQPTGTQPHHAPSGCGSAWKNQGNGAHLIRHLVTACAMQLGHPHLRLHPLVAPVSGIFDLPLCGTGERGPILRRADGQQGGPLCDLLPCRQGSLVPTALGPVPYR